VRMVMFQGTVLSRGGGGRGVVSHKRIVITWSRLP
jgi:hypothetical protein